MNHKTYFYYLKGSRSDSANGHNEETWLVEESPRPFKEYKEESSRGYRKLRQPQRGGHKL